MTKPDFETELHKHICHWVGGMTVVSVGAALNMLEKAYSAGCANCAKELIDAKKRIASLEAANIRLLGELGQARASTPNATAPAPISA